MVHPVLKTLINQKQADDQLWLLCPRGPNTANAQAVSLEVLRNIVRWEKKVSALLSPHQEQRSRWDLPMSTLGSSNVQHPITEEVGRRVAMLKVLIGQIAEEFDTE